MMDLILFISEQELERLLKQISNFRQTFNISEKQNIGVGCYLEKEGRTYDGKKENLHTISLTIDWDDTIKSEILNTGFEAKEIKK